MMRFAKIICMLFIFATAAVGCSNDEPVLQPVKYDVPTYCSPEIAHEAVVVFHDQTSFDAAFGDCADKLPTIDFNEYSLAVVTGTTNAGVLEQSMNNTENGYSLNIVVAQNYLTVVLPWTVSYKVQHGTKAEDIQLSIEYRTVTD